jgi:hypothetical protein
LRNARAAALGVRVGLPARGCRALPRRRKCALTVAVGMLAA